MGKQDILSENAQTVAESRYFMEGEDWQECCKRIARTVSSVETDKKYFDLFFEMIHNRDFLPGGRILRNCGRPSGSLFNCYHLPCGDSIEEIGQFIKDALILWSDGGGVGCNFSQLRPKGDQILGKGGHSSGLVSFIKAADGVAETIESGGARRAAALASVDVTHPEVCDFIDAKLHHGILPHFNISVAINQEFLNAVEEDQDWEFKFKQRSYGKVKARSIWDKIIENMIKCAEPGLLNWDYLRKNNSYYYDPVTGTNPCGEAVLAPYDVCNLGSLVLPSFITGSVYTNWRKLEHTVELAVRFLDNVIDVNKYSLKEIDIKAHNSRRIGIGVMGLAEYLFAKDVRYGSEKSIEEAEKVMRFIRNVIYQTLVKLAEEKGAFPKFEKMPYVNASFVKKLPGELRMDIKKYGSRCVTAMAIAPTGTISLLADVTSGIEPLFAKSFIRRDRVGERVYVHPLYEQFLSEGKEVPDWYVDSFDLEPKDHFNIQAAVQRFVDGAVSKTINMPAGTTDQQLSDLLLEYIKDLKGVTVYVDGVREGQIYNRMEKEQVIEYLKENGRNIERDLSVSDIACSLDDNSCGE